MTVFVLLWAVPYEGSTLLGVYATREAAYEAWDRWAADYTSVRESECLVREVTLDGTAEIHY